MTHYEFDPSIGCLRGTSATHEIRVLAWPKLMAYRRAIGSVDWKAWRPDFPLTGEPLADDALEAFVATIPAEVRRLAGRYSSRQWEVVRWCALAGYGGESVCEANPALGFMMALSPQFGRPSKVARPSALPAVLAFTKQRRLLGWLGFPPTEPVRRVLSRIEPTAINVAGLLLLRKALARVEVPPRLAHAPRINADLLLLAGHGLLDAVSASLFETLSKGDGGELASRSARQIVSTAALWRRVRPGELRPVFQSNEHVRAVGRELTAERRMLPAASRTPDFPAPPVPGTVDIQPLVTRVMLDYEGHEQRNCVATYWRRVAAGRVAIYRVLAPERCTLSLVKRDGRWVIGQLEAARNQPVRPETRAAVLAWLRSARPPRRTLALSPRAQGLPLD